MCVLVETGNTLGRIEGHEKGGCHSIHYRSKAPSRIATAGKDGQLLTHAGPPFKLAHKEPAHTGRAYCCRYAPDEETLVSCGEDGRLVFYEPVSGEKTSEVTICEGQPLFSLDWSPDGSMIAIAGNSGLIIFNHKTFEVVTHLECFNEACIGVQWSGNYWIAVAAISSHLHGFRLKTPTEFELEHENYLAEQANHLMLDIAEPEAESVAAPFRNTSAE
ncbi:MAG: uncharacterized protein KVP18_001145 [Porospora cf. gigantea A]|nr:MAG: hypothetical protein KVP18_001145 [Porospora cf. gigantea A]